MESGDKNKCVEFSFSILYCFFCFKAENGTNGKSCVDIDAALCTQFGRTQGSSERNVVRRWCSEQGLVRDFWPYIILVVC